MLYVSTLWDCENTRDTLSQGYLDRKKILSSEKKETRISVSVHQRVIYHRGTEKYIRSVQHCFSENTHHYVLQGDEGLINPFTRFLLWVTSWRKKVKYSTQKNRVLDMFLFLVVTLSCISTSLNVF